MVRPPTLLRAALLGASRASFRRSYAYDYLRPYDPKHSSNLDPPPAHSQPNHPQTNHSHPYNHQQYQQYQQYHGNGRRPWLQRLLYANVALVAATAFAYYMWWPKHTFPLSVAKILRKGLWAESDKGENDYELALKHYLDALVHCNEIGMDPLCDEYTGIQLKVGEMFERLNLLEDAALVYNEIATLYLTVLTSDPSSKEGKRVTSRAHRGHLIQKDLRLAIKLVEMNRPNPQLSRAILMTHLLIAQDEVTRHLGLNNIASLSQLKTKDVDGSGKQVPDLNEYKADFAANTIEISVNGTTSILQKSPEAWEPFADEFFNAMDLLSAICVSTGNLAMATKTKISMTEWMLLADVEAHKVLLSQCNLASLLYLQAEEYEGQEIAIRTALHGNDPASALSKQERDKETANYNLAVLNKEKCLQLSIKSYESVLEFAKTLPREATSKISKPEDNDDHNIHIINETVALATYGLGVVNLHLSNYEKAERLLRESRVKSKNCGYNDLILEIERELGKLFKEKKVLGEGKERSNSGELSPIEMDIQISNK